MRWEGGGDGAGRWKERDGEGVAGNDRKKNEIQNEWMCKKKNIGG